MAARHTVTTLAMTTLLVWIDVAFALEWVDGNRQSCDIAASTPETDIRFTSVWPTRKEREIELDITFVTIGMKTV
jgi:hypothetical protein